MFYGWWIVGVCFLIALYVGGVIFYGFTAIFEPIANEFGWSYAQISLASSLRGLEVGLLAPLMGLLVDRWGPRRLIFGGVTIASLGLVLLSYTTSLGMFYGAFTLVAIGMSGCSSTVLITTVANWFHNKVGLATGITMCGFGASGLLIPLVVRLIDMSGWRPAIVILGLGMLGIGLPLSLLVRRRPAQYSYLPDGEANDAVTPDRGLASGQTVKGDIGAKQALKSSTFWHISLAVMCQFMVVSAVATHVMPYLSSIGIARTTAGFVASAIPLLSITGRLGFGWLGDKLDNRQITAVGFAMIGLGLLSFAYISPGGMWLLVPFLSLFAVAYGGNNTTRGVLLRKYFGRSNFGTIYGFMMGIAMIGTIAGAPLAGWVFDNWGSYQGIWFAFAALAVVALIVIATTPPVNANRINNTP
ncbi:L-lactate transporter [subsurface metagenome]